MAGSLQQSPLDVPPHLLLCDTSRRNHKLFLSSDVFLPRQPCLCSADALTEHLRSSSPRAAPLVCRGPAWRAAAYARGAQAPWAFGRQPAGSVGLLWGHGEQRNLGLFLRKQALRPSLNKCFTDPSEPGCPGALAVPVRPVVLGPSCSTAS